MTYHTRMLATKTVTLPSSPTTMRSPLWCRDFLRVLGASISWPLLLAMAMLTSLGVGWILLGILLLGAGPSTDADPPSVVAALVVLAGTGILAWLVAEFFASVWVVGLVLGSTLILLLVARVTWTLSSADRGHRPGCLGAWRRRYGRVAGLLERSSQNQSLGAAQCDACKESST